MFESKILLLNPGELISSFFNSFLIIYIYFNFHPLIFYLLDVELNFFLLFSTGFIIFSFDLLRISF